MEHSSPLSVASNAVLDGASPTFIMRDGIGGYYIFADDISADDFLTSLETGFVDLETWVSRVKPACLQCLTELHPMLFEPLAVAQRKGAWRAQSSSVDS